MSALDFTTSQPPQSSVEPTTLSPTATVAGTLPAAGAGAGAGAGKLPREIELIINLIERFVAKPDAERFETTPEGKKPKLKIDLLNQAINLCVTFDATEILQPSIAKLLEAGWHPDYIVPGQPNASALQQLLSNPSLFAARKIPKHLVPLIELLVTHGASLFDLHPLLHQTPLQMLLCFSRTSVENFQSLLGLLGGTCPELINYQGGHPGQPSAIWGAANTKNYVAVDFFLAHGGDLFVTYPFRNSTPIHEILFNALTVKDHTSRNKALSYIKQLPNDHPVLDQTALSQPWVYEKSFLISCYSPVNILHFLITGTEKYGALPVDPRWQVQIAEKINAIKALRTGLSTEDTKETPPADSAPKATIRTGLPKEFSTLGKFDDCVATASGASLSLHPLTEQIGEMIREFNPDLDYQLHLLLKMHLQSDPTDTTYLSKENGEYLAENIMQLFDSILEPFKKTKLQINIRQFPRLDEVWAMTMMLMTIGYFSEPEETSSQNRLLFYAIQTNYLYVFNSLMTSGLKGLYVDERGATPISEILSQPIETLPGFHQLIVKQIFGAELDNLNSILMPPGQKPLGRFFAYALDFKTKTKGTFLNQEVFNQVLYSLIKHQKEHKLQRVPNDENNIDLVFGMTYVQIAASMSEISPLNLRLLMNIYPEHLKETYLTHAEALKTCPLDIAEKEGNRVFQEVYEKEINDCIKKITQRITENFNTGTRLFGGLSPAGKRALIAGGGSGAAATALGTVSSDSLREAERKQKELLEEEAKEARSAEQRKRETETKAAQAQAKKIAQQKAREAQAQKKAIAEAQQAQALAEKKAEALRKEQEEAKKRSELTKEKPSAGAGAAAGDGSVESSKPLKKPKSSDQKKAARKKLQFYRKKASEVEYLRVTDEEDCAHIAARFAASTSETPPESSHTDAGMAGVTHHPSVLTEDPIKTILSDRIYSHLFIRTGVLKTTAEAQKPSSDYIFVTGSTLDPDRSNPADLDLLVLSDQTLDIQIRYQDRLHQELTTLGFPFFIKDCSSRTDPPKYQQLQISLLEGRYKTDITFYSTKDSGVDGKLRELASKAPVSKYLFWDVATDNLYHLGNPKAFQIQRNPFHTSDRDFTALAVILKEFGLKAPEKPFADKNSLSLIQFINTLGRHLYTATQALQQMQQHLSEQRDWEIIWNKLTKHFNMTPSRTPEEIQIMDLEIAAIQTAQAQALKHMEEAEKAHAVYEQIQSPDLQLLSQACSYVLHKYIPQQPQESQEKLYSMLFALIGKQALEALRTSAETRPSHRDNRHGAFALHSHGVAGRTTAMGAGASVSGEPAYYPRR